MVTFLVTISLAVPAAIAVSYAAARLAVLYIEKTCDCDFCTHEDQS